MYKFEFDLTRNQYIEYNTYHQNHSPFFKQKNMLSRIGLPIVFLAIFIFAVAIGLDFSKAVIMAVVFIIISLIYNLFFDQFNTMTLKRKIKEMEQEGHAPYQKHSELIFNDDSFTEIIPDDENVVPYGKIERIVELKNLLLIYVSALTACIIPISVFTSQDQKEEFISFLEEKSGVQRSE